MKLRHLGIIAVCFFIGSWSFADTAEKWGKGVKQQDGSTVYKRTFELPASHWEPSDVTNYLADLEYTKLHIAEANGGRYLHVLYFDQENDIRTSGNLTQQPSSTISIPANIEMTIKRNDKNQIQKINFSANKYYYIDLDGDGKLDLFHNHMNNRSFIMTKDQILRVFPKRTKDQDIQTSFTDKGAIGVGSPDSRNHHHPSYPQCHFY